MTRDAVVGVERIGVGICRLEVMLALVVMNDVGPEVLVVDLVEYRSDGGDAERHEQHARRRAHQLRRQAEDPPHHVKSSEPVRAASRLAGQHVVGRPGSGGRGLKQ